ncbi:unnamed protein product [Peronospora belbahrii]|uniref:Uncharacterized protein n=1 Tax=Peronospora belbahrii TaxID=622444 RepID=A0ABN8CZK3_9STRA|nr:unnamed protein product [Peronospora belbahrii]
MCCHEDMDIIAKLVSPSKVLQDSCGREDMAELDRPQQTLCVADSLQSFAGETQQPVKDLLMQCNTLYNNFLFLWMNNSVVVKGARKELVLALARLDVIEKIDLEQVLAF